MGHVVIYISISQPQQYDTVSTLSDDCVQSLCAVDTFVANKTASKGPVLLADRVSDCHLSSENTLRSNLWPCVAPVNALNQCYNRLRGQVLSQWIVWIHVDWKIDVLDLAEWRFSMGSSFGRCLLAQCTCLFMHRCRLGSQQFKVKRRNQIGVSCVGTDH